MEREIIFTVAEQDAWEEEWERRTGLCRSCGDTGVSSKYSCHRRCRFTRRPTPEAGKGEGR